MSASLTVIAVLGISTPSLPERTASTGHRYAFPREDATVADVRDWLRLCERLGVSPDTVTIDGVLTGPAASGAFTTGTGREMTVGAVREFIDRCDQHALPGDTTLGEGSADLAVSVAVRLDRFDLDTADGAQVNLSVTGVVADSTEFVFETLPG